MIDIACPQCGVVYHTLEANVGKHILCTKCGNVITVVLAVTPRSPSAPTVSKPVTTSGRKRRRTYTVGIVAAAAVVLIAFLSLRYTNTPKEQVSANKTDEAQKWTIAGEETPPASAQPADPRPTEYNSLPSGTRIEEDSGTSGHGKLAVENGTSEDAVARLSDTTTDQTVRWFFVKAHSSAHMSRIPQGTYRLAYTTGLNWVESNDAFSWQPTYDEFERTLDYDEHRDSEGVKYHTVRVTLNSVLFGNVRTRTITREEFLRGHRHIPLQPESSDATR
jgi:hypothetical protein